MEGKGGKSTTVQEPSQCKKKDKNSEIKTRGTGSKPEVPNKTPGGPVWDPRTGGVG